MASFIEANRLYNEGKYEEAYFAYQALGEIFGEGIIRYQLESLEKKLGNRKNVANISKSKKHSQLKFEELDDASKILLSNMGEAPLQSEEYSQILSSWQKKTSKKSEDAATKQVNPIPSDWLKNLLLPPLPKNVNDFIWKANRNFKKDRITEDQKRTLYYNSDIQQKPYSPDYSILFS